MGMDGIGNSVARIRTAGANIMDKGAEKLEAGARKLGLDPKTPDSAEANTGGITKGISSDRCSLPAQRESGLPNSSFHRLDNPFMGGRSGFRELGPVIHPGMNPIGLSGDNGPKATTFKGNDGVTYEFPPNIKDMKPGDALPGGKVLGPSGPTGGAHGGQLKPNQVANPNYNDGTKGLTGNGLGGLKLDTNPFKSPFEGGHGPANNAPNSEMYNQIFDKMGPGPAVLPDSQQMVRGMMNDSTEPQPMLEKSFEKNPSMDFESIRGIDLGGSKDQETMKPGAGDFRLPDGRKDLAGMNIDPGDRKIMESFRADKTTDNIES